MANEEVKVVDMEARLQQGQLVAQVELPDITSLSTEQIQALITIPEGITQIAKRVRDALLGLSGKLKKQRISYGLRGASIALLVHRAGEAWGTLRLTYEMRSCRAIAFRLDGLVIDCGHIFFDEKGQVDVPPISPSEESLLIQATPQQTREINASPRMVAPAGRA